MHNHCITESNEMTNQLPLVLVSTLSPNEGSLQLEDGETVEVGTTRWFKWLDEEHNSFRFESGFAGEHSFTARKHERESGAFWYAYRKLSKKLCNAYLGKSERLTVERMVEVAGKLSGEPKLGNGYAQSAEPSGYALECITRPQERLKDEQDFKSEVRVQDREIQALKDELHQLRSQLEDMAAHAAEWYEKAKEYEQQLQDKESVGAPLPDLEVVRDRILQSLKLGKQAPEYKRTKATLDRFIHELQQQ